MRKPAFTIIELLIAIAIIVIMIGILLPSLSRSRAQAKVLTCGANLSQVGRAIFSYANEHKGLIPYGPEAPPPTATNFYPVTGTVTSLISLENGKPVGLGLLLERNLADSPQSLFCTDPDDPVDVELELSKVGITQAQGGYYYRHGSGGSLTGPPDKSHLKLDNLGKNNNGKTIKALAMDSQFVCSPSLAIFRVIPKTNHRRQTVNILFSDGHVAAQGNQDKRYTVDIGAFPYNAFGQILDAFENADEAN